MDETIARAYTGHHQVVNAIYRDEGGDMHMKEKGGLHFGIRKLCTPFFDTEEQAQPSGVTMLPTLDTEEEAPSDEDGDETSVEGD